MNEKMTIEELEKVLTGEVLNKYIAKLNVIASEFVEETKLSPLPFFLHAIGMAADAQHVDIGWAIKVFVSGFTGENPNDITVMAAEGRPTAPDKAALN